MAYRIDTDENRIQDILEEIEMLKNQAYSHAVPSTNVSTRHTGVQTSTGGTTVKKQSLGNLSGTKSIDFNTFDENQLFGNQVGQDVVLTFKNIPDNLSTNVKIYMTPADVNGSLTIGGNDIFSSTTDPFSIKPLVTTDFLSIEMESTDNSTINITSVKKNDEEEANVIPGIPGNIYAIGNTSSSVVVSYDQPETGTLPITYDIAWSTSPAGNSTDGPTTPAAGSPLTGITENLETVTGLSAATTYYFWVRGVNTVGSGLWAGPQQTNTEGTSNPGAVNFAIPGATVLFNSITITWDQPGALLFTLFRTDPDGTVITLQRRSTADADIVDTSNIQPNTNYNYTLETYNEFGTQLGTQTINLNSAGLPTPTLILTTQGRKLNFNFTIPAGIKNAFVEWALDSGFTIGVVDNNPVIKLTNINTPEIQNFLTQDLNLLTQYFGRVRFELNDEFGPYSTVQNATTTSLPTPREPTFGQTSPGTGVLKMVFRFNDAQDISEGIKIRWRPGGTVDDFQDFQGSDSNQNLRSLKPSDNVATDENRITIARRGGGYGAMGIVNMTGNTINSITITKPGAGFNNNDQVTILEAVFGSTGDINDTGVTGQAIVSGGNLIGVDNFSNTTNDISDGDTVIIAGQNSNSQFNTWSPGDQVTIRASAVNATDESDPDFETDNVDN